MQAMHPILAEAVRRARWCEAPETAVIKPAVAELVPAPMPAAVPAPRKWPWFEMVPLLDWRTPLVVAVDASIEERIEAVIGLLNRRVVSVPLVQRATARVFDITVEDITGREHRHKFAIPRDIAIAISRRLTDKSTPQIGRMFGARDASTVWHAASKWRPKVEAAVAACRQRQGADSWGKLKEISRETDTMRVG